MRAYVALLIGSGSMLIVAAACTGRDAPAGRGPGATGSGGASNALSAIGPQGSTGSGNSESVVADPASPCDAGLDVDSNDPLHAAAALGICSQVDSADDWGLLAARWAMADGSAATVNPSYHLGHGLLPRFGAEVEPQEGERLLVLSSGTARTPDDDDFISPMGFDKGIMSPSPDGYPKESPACEGITSGPTHDDVALELVLRAPPTAESLAFDFNFFTYEWPDWVCSEFNDFFLAFLAPIPAGQTDGNISFDSEDNVVSVNNALVRVCDCPLGSPCTAPPMGPTQIDYDCEQGDGELDGTGFEGHAATSWLVTRAPVEPDEEINLRFTIYDSADGVLDSTVVIDNFRWLGDAETDPVTDPK